MGARPVPRVGDPATRGVDAAGFAGVGGESVAEEGGRAARALAGGDDVGVLASPESVVDGFGVAVSAAAEFALDGGGGGGSVASAAEAIARFVWCGLKALTTGSYRTRRGLSALASWRARPSSVAR